MNRSGAEGEGPFSNTNQVFVLSREEAMQENIFFDQDLYFKNTKAQIAERIVSGCSLSFNLDP